MKKVEDKRKSTKTKFALATALACLGGMLFCQSITVTSPRSGVTWNRGSTYTIQWTTAAEPVPRPAIDSPENGGSLSPPPGSGFKIRIELVGDTLADESDFPFTISERPLGPFDLEPINFSYDDDSGQFKFTLRNWGESFSGDFTAIRDFNASGLGLVSAGFPHVTIASREDKTFSFPASGWPGGDCGSINGRLVIITIPPESRTENNTKISTLWKRNHASSHIEFPIKVGTQAKVVAEKDAVIELRDYNISYREWIKDGCGGHTQILFYADVRVRNCGGKPSNKLDLVIYKWNSCPGPGTYVVTSRFEGMVIQPGEIQTRTLPVKMDFWPGQKSDPWMMFKIVLYDGDTPGRIGFLASEHKVVLHVSWWK